MIFGCWNLNHLASRFPTLRADIFNIHMCSRFLRADIKVRTFVCGQLLIYSRQLVLGSSNVLAPLGLTGLSAEQFPGQIHSQSCCKDNAWHCKSILSFYILVKNSLLVRKQTWFAGSDTIWSVRSTFLAMRFYTVSSSSLETSLSWHALIFITGEDTQV